MKKELEERFPDNFYKPHSVNILVHIEKMRYIFEENWNKYERFLLDMGFTINQEKLYHTEVFDKNKNLITFYDRCEDRDSGEISESIDRIINFYNTTKNKN